jgi:hypothetical protein
MIFSGIGIKDYFDCETSRSYDPVESSPQLFLTDMAVTSKKPAGFFSSLPFAL